MKIDRRGFVKFVVGAGVGFHLTPWPWKLMDDVAIWTQNWPWVPRLTRYPAQDFHPTVCTLCEGGCGLFVRVINGERTVKAEGLPAAPVNQGKLCPLGAAGPQYQYSLARFQGPLKRIGARGAGAWAKLDWSQALQEVGGRLADLRKEGKAGSVVMVSGRRSCLTRALAERFMNAYGSPNLVDLPSLAGARAVADKAQFGPGVQVGYDLESTGYILSFGAGLLEGWGSPVQSIRAFNRLQAGGGRVVQIDSRASLTASKAGKWIAVAPGTEAALALGLATIFIADGLYDEKFVGAYTHGFDQFKDLLYKEYTPEKVEAITGVPQETIRQLAHEFAKSQPGVAVAGRGRGDLPTPVYELMAVMALNALAGNINRTGGVIIKKDLPLAEWPELILDQAAQDSLASPRLDLARSEKYPFSESLLHHLVEAIETGPTPVEVLIIDQANPAYFGADPGAFQRALAKVPLVVTLSSLADDTSYLADFVLPAALNFDGPADVVNPPGLPYPLFGAAEAVLDKGPFDTRPAGDIYLGLAEAVGGAVAEAMPFKSHREMVARTAAGLFASGRGLVAEAGGISSGVLLGDEVSPSQFKDEEEFLKALQAGLFWYDPAFEFGRLEGVFKTETGQFEFLSQTLQTALAGFVGRKGEAAALEELGVTLGGEAAYLPHYEPVVPSDPEKTLPLLLVPVEQFKLVNRFIGNAPYLTKSLEDITLKENDLVVEVNPETARELHLSNGDRAVLKTRKGQFTVRVYLYQGARPGVVYAPLGLGHHGFDLYLRGKGANPMEIVEPITDPLSGEALWWGTRANLIKV
ncbi:MAG: molybdopterin-dependent oxidoreductase [Thermodesulfobacteriota bacterium]